MMKVKVGDQVALSEQRQKTRLVEVIKVGRKYITVKDWSRDRMFDGETGRLAHFDYGNPPRIMTIEDWEAGKRDTEARDWLAGHGVHVDQGAPWTSEQLVELLKPTVSA